jgi:uncharacterized protein with ParB-like and HNH nuclease domain
MSVKIQGKEHPLKKIFRQDFVFVIPPYQRPYSWKTEHAGELFEDLVNAMQHGAGGEPEPYFLGSVVLAKGKNAPDAQATQVLTKTEWTPAVLEDRQQRLSRQLTDVWRLHATGGEANG